MAQQFSKLSDDSDMPLMKMAVTDESKIAVVLCTPLMQRVHTLVKESGDLCYVMMESSSRDVKERKHCHITLLLTHSCIGSLPLGALITTSSGKRTITAALELYASMLPANCFGGRGVIGPQLFVTEDCQSVRKALGNVFPQASLVLCVNHVLQVTWRWLWDPENDIPKDSKPGHLSHMERMVYASSESELQWFYVDSMSDQNLMP